MNKLFKFVTILILFAGLTYAQTGVFFSEYIEGGGNNKALEIYNGSGSEIDLSDYIIKINYNGKAYNEIFTFGAKTLASGDVFVISHAEADGAITSVADTLVVNPYSGGTSYIVSFNGDDVRALCKVNGTDTTVVDIIGLYDLVDPGSGWSVAGTDNGTKDHTLVRKETVTSGNTDWAVSAGTNADNSEWMVKDKDTFDYLGSHTMGSSNVELDLNLTFEDDSDVANWSHWDEANLWTAEAHNSTAGVGGSGALELGDGGYGMIAKRKVNTTSGTNFALSVDIKTEGWGVPETYKLYLYTQGFANLDSVEINSDSGYTTFTITGVATSDSGYIKIAGNNTAGQNYVWVDNLLFDDDSPAVAKPEPSEYPTNVLAIAAGTSITVTWDEATSGDLPDGYLGMMNTTGVFTPPVDGVPVEDSEGFGNFPYGTDSLLITNMESEKIFYFTIYPYSNSGTDIDYKTDGTAPIASDTTGTGPNAILFSDFETGFEDWTPHSVVSTKNWVHKTGTGANSTGGYAEMSGYQEAELSNDYLIAGPFNLNNFTDEYMEFWSATKYGNFDTELTLEFSIDYDGSANPSTFTWSELTFTRPDNNNDTWSQSGTVALDAINSDVVYIAFHYKSNGTDIGRWKIDEVGIYGTPAQGIDLPPVVVSVKRDVLIPNEDQNTVVSAVVTDDKEISTVTLIYSNDGENFSGVNMTLSDTAWIGTIPESLYSDGDLFGYFVAATDNIGQTDTSDITMLRAGNTPINRIKNQNDDGSIEMEGVIARVTGTVSAGTGTYSSGRIEAYMQDSTAGILVIKFNTETPAMVENNNYTVTGNVIQYNGLIEIEPIDAELDIIDNGVVDSLKAMETSIADINNNPENFESRLIKILGVSISDDTPWLGSGSSGTTMDIYVGSDTLSLRVDADTDIWGSTSPTFPLDVIGVLGQYDRDSPYNSGYQLLPRKLSDFLTPVGVNDNNNIPTVYAMEQNYPNPFNPTTKINFSLPENGMVTIKIFDVLGREVTTLIHKEMNASNHTVEFDASQLTSGIYLYKIQVNDFVSVKKMMLMK